MRDIFKPVKETKYVRKKFNITKPFMYAHSRIIPDKHFDWVIEAFQHVDEKYELVVSGHGKEEYVNTLKELAKQLKLDHRIHFAGRISDEDLVALHNEAEVFVLGAPNEEFGIVSVEAMACGTPAVAWGDGAGPTEIIDHGVTGCLAKAYDKKDLAKQMVEATKLKKNKKQIMAKAATYSEEAQKEVFLDGVKKLV